VRASVRDLLSSSPSFNALPPAQQHALADRMSKVAAFIVAGADGDTIPTAGSVTIEFRNEVDFPAFVSALIKGVFQAIVNASIEQMDAYATLLEEVALTVDQFVDEAGDDDGTQLSRPRPNRQQVLASMVLMGINRIVLTDGTVKSRVRLSFKPATGKQLLA